MSLREDIQERIKQVMKAGDSETLSVLRILWSAIRNEEIDKKQELNDEEVQGVISRQVKQLKDALQDFENSEREDLTNKTKAEIEILSDYLPEQISEDAISTVVDEVLVELGGKENVQIGAVMGAVMKKIKGQADGNIVREIVTKKLL